MSVRATNWAWEKGRELVLPQGLRFLLVRIGDHADNDGVCWPGMDGLADYLGCDESTVRRNMKKLEDHDLLHRERRLPKSGRGRRTDTICLHLDQPGKTPGRSEGPDEPPGNATNRAPRTDGPDRPTGHLPPDQPGTSARPYIEEPTGTSQGEEPSTEGSSPDIHVNEGPPTAKEIRAKAWASGHLDLDVLTDAEIVFLCWVDAAEKRDGDTLLTTQRRELINRRRKVYPLADLVDCVRGWLHSPHHRGENKEGTAYNSLKLLLRDADQIEKFRDLQRGRAAKTSRKSASDELARRRRPSP